MSHVEDQRSADSGDLYQKQKLYIEELIVNKSVDDYEKELKAFLSKYGTIIDIKILQNRKLIRTTEILCLCDI